MNSDILKKQREGLIAYLKLKLEQEDWHGVADAAMDIREIDAQLRVLNSAYGVFSASQPPPF